MSLFALVDCNNFYASCERAFNPRLEGQPIVVLSNNDGCIIARSNEAKKLGIPMGAPYFKWEPFCREHGVQVFSSNYTLYGDMSQRVMSIIAENCPHIEIYSIDEAFLFLKNLPEHELMDYALKLRQQIKLSTGIPVSIGIATTKTLAKAANIIAKNQNQSGVFRLNDETMYFLKDFPVEKIWGVGSRFAERLNRLNIFTADDLRVADPKSLRQQFNVTIEKMIYELRGIPHLHLETPAPRKQIISSRSFGKTVNNLSDIEEAISHYAAIATQKLREQESVAGGLSVFLQTNIFRKDDPQYENSCSFPFPIPTANTGYIIGIAKKCIRYLYRKEFRYHKTGIMLLNIMPNSVEQMDWISQTPAKENQLMKTVDLINDHYGRDAVFFGSEGIKRDWLIKSTKRSKRYTTHWNEILSI